MKLSEKLLIGERAWFVGRARELEMIRRHAAGDSERIWLHFYGQGGIGKTSLLRMFRSELKDACCFYLDGSRGISHKEDVLEQLAEQLRIRGGQVLASPDPHDIVQRMNRLSLDTGKNVVLIIDTFENMRPVEDWLAEWLHQWEETTRIVTAGRNPLTGGWLRFGWAGLIETTQLHALASSEVERYADIRGLGDNRSLSTLIQFSGGIPLAWRLRRR